MMPHAAVAGEGAVVGLQFPDGLLVGELQQQVAAVRAGVVDAERHGAQGLGESLGQGLLGQRGGGEVQRVPAVGVGRRGEDTAAGGEAQRAPARGDPPVGGERVGGG